MVYPLSAKLHKMVKNTQFVGKLPTNCLSVSDNFVGLALKGLRSLENIWGCIRKNDDYLLCSKTTWINSITNSKRCFLKSPITNSPGNSKTIKIFPNFPPSTSFSEKSICNSIIHEGPKSCPWVKFLSAM